MDSYIITTECTVQAMPEPAGEDGCFTIHQLQEAVGGYVQTMALPIGTVTRGRVEEFIALVDDEGMLKDAKVNPLATLLMGSMAHPIVGNVVIIPERRLR